MRSTADRIEARLVEREPQQVERLVLVLLQRAQRAAHVLAAGANLQLDRLALHAGMEGGAVEIAGAFVERRDRHLGEPGLVVWVLRRRRRGTRNSIETSGTVASRTSQNSMPAGLTTRSILVAAAGTAQPHQEQSRDTSAEHVGPASVDGRTVDSLLIDHERSSFDPAGLMR